MPVPFEIDVQTLDQLRRSDDPPVVLDVREGWELDICSLEGSMHIPLANLPQRAGDLPKDRNVVVVCHHGVRSAQATMWLRNQGYSRTINLAGGLDAWAHQIDPNMKVY
jgi:rhodanese-related sulfurtransferase